MSFFGIKTAFRMVIIASVTIMAAACGDDDPKPDPDEPKVHVSGLNITPVELSLVEGETSQLEIKVIPENATDKSYTAVSSNTDVATVNATGLVTAVTEGSCEITIKTVDGGYDAKCRVEVKKAAVRVTGISLLGPSSEIHVYDLIGLQAIVKPADATNSDVEWEYDKSFFNVEVNPSDHHVISARALRSGYTTISAVTKDGGFRATKNYMITTVPLKGLSLSPTSMALSLNESATITPIFTPANATNQHLTWNSDDESIATVDANGKVTAKGFGETWVKAKATDGGFTASCKVSVKGVKATSAYLSGPATISRASYNSGTSYYVSWTISPEQAKNNPFHFEFEDSHTFGIDKATGRIFVNYMGVHKYRLVMDDGSGVVSNWVITRVVD